MPNPIRLGEEKELRRVEALLGGPKVIRHKLKTRLDAHDVILQGLPNECVFLLLEALPVLRGNALLERAIGMSLRTFQRKKTAPAKPLSREQSGRTWKFAELLAKAIEIFGSKQEAEEWLQRPAMGLDDRRPIELLETPAGVKLVEDFLTRLEYGVYT
jgi:putative toxin-antitoxin system antitoxin component (TIGR02293 family)